MSVAHSLSTKRILLIVGGGIAAYKSLDLVRRLRERGASVRVVMTQAATQFVTPLAAGAVSGEKVFTDLFSRDDEHDVGHIRLSREADLILVAPATADLLAKMAHGIANDGHFAGHRQTRACCAGHEPAHVVASGDTAQCRDACR